MITKKYSFPPVGILRTLPGFLIPLMTPQQMLTHYLAASFGYYILDESVFDDQDFDALCKRLLSVFDTFEHPHKHLTSIERLEEGTGYHISEENYPPQVRLGFASYVRNLNNGHFEYAIQRMHLIGEAAYLAEVNAEHYGSAQQHYQ